MLTIDCRCCVDLPYHPCLACNISTTTFSEQFKLIDWPFFFFLSSVPDDLTPEEQEELENIRRRKQELLGDIQVMKNWGVSFIQLQLWMF